MAVDATQAEIDRAFSLVDEGISVLRSVVPDNELAFRMLSFHLAESWAESLFPPEVLELARDARAEMNGRLDS